MSIYVYPPTTIDTAGLATEAKQDVMIGELQDANTELDAQTVLLTSLDGKDFATQTTLNDLLTTFIAEDFATETTVAALLAAFNAEDFASETTLNALLTELQLKADLTETQPVSIASLPLPTGAATEATVSAADTKLGELNARLGGSLAPVEHDELEITYVAAGNGAGEVETVIYKLSAATVATLTLSYDASNRLTGVVKS